MNRFLKKAGLGAVLAATVVTATAAPADAQRWRGGYGYRHHGGGRAATGALIGGIVGLGLGAAIASNNRGYYDRGYYGGYYDTPPRVVYRDRYYAPPPPPPVVVRERVYDRGYGGYYGDGYYGY